VLCSHKTCSVLEIIKDMFHVFQLRRYVGNVEEWDYSEEQKVSCMVYLCHY